MLVYCDPKTWPEDPEGWFIAVGVHPKYALDFGDYYFDRLSKLLDSPAVSKALRNTIEYFEVDVGAGSAVYASGVSHPGLGG